MSKFEDIIDSLNIKNGASGLKIESNNLDFSPFRGKYFNFLKASSKDDVIFHRISDFFEFIVGNHFQSKPKELKKGLMDIFLFPLLSRNLLYTSKQAENSKAKRTVALAGFVILESLRFTLAAVLMIIPSLMIILLHTIYNTPFAIKKIHSAISYIGEEFEYAKKGLKMQLQSLGVFKHKDDSEKYAESSEKLVVLNDKQTTPPTNNY